MMGWFFAFATWLDVLAISACVGMFVCAVWLLPCDAPSSLKNAVWNGFGWAVALLTIASSVLLASRTLEFSGASFSELGHFLPLVLKRTQYGLIWSWRMGAVGVLWWCWLAHRHGSKGRISKLLAVGALLLVVFSRSATGHAGDHGIFAPTVWVDSLHVLSGAIWVGSLFAMSLRVLPWLSSVAIDERRLILDVFGRLSTTAGAALLTILITGAFNAWVGLGRIGVLWHSHYGRILLAKLALVAWMVGLGAHNRYVKVPALAHWAHRMPGPHPLVGGAVVEALPESDARPLQVSARAVNTESLLGIGVLAAAALLHHAMPPTDLHHLKNEASLPDHALNACAAANDQCLQSNFCRLAPTYPLQPIRRANSKRQGHATVLEAPAA